MVDQKIIQALLIVAKTTETHRFITNRRVDLLTCWIQFFDNYDYIDLRIVSRIA